MNRKEMMDCLNSIATNILTRKTTLSDAHILLAIRSVLMKEKEHTGDDIDNHAELHISAGILGKKGGLSKSEAKIKASRTNGARGGRPKKPWS